MRVHGEKVISRRKNIETCSDYHDYLPELREDFQHMCGYCGKIEAITKNAFEIDHFIPKKYAKEKENDYNNLVYSCYVCNRKNRINGHPKIQKFNLLIVKVLLILHRMTMIVMWKEEKTGKSMGSQKLVNIWSRRSLNLIYGQFARCGNL